jgi:hypothetical protein|nr:MAG TPA: hypothetical protein [Caudoviricetes sp.]
MLRNESTYKLPLNKNTYRAIKMQTGTTIDVEKYLNDCINEYRDDESGNGLFNADKKTFWSASLLRRMEKYETLKEKRSQAANARWNKEKDKKQEADKKQEKNAKKCKSIKNICKSNTNAYKKRYKCKANLKKSYANLCKLNQIKSNQIKLNKIKLKEMKSIYPSNHKPEENKTLDDMMDKMEKTEFERLIKNCEMHIFSPELAIEMTEILKEMYMTPNIREKVQEINSKKLCYALKNFAIANTRSQIKIPKSYFKKCILSALDQTELSGQYDTDTIYEMEDY